MAEYDSSTINYGKFDKSAAAPDLGSYATADEGLTASAKQAAQTVEILNMFAKEGKAAYMAKVDKERRDAAEARRKEMGPISRPNSSCRAAWTSSPRASRSFCENSVPRGVAWERPAFSGRDSSWAWRAGGQACKAGEKKTRRVAAPHRGKRFSNSIPSGYEGPKLRPVAQAVGFGSVLSRPLSPRPHCDEVEEERLGTSQDF